jgi:hypothetical protein
MAELALFAGSFAIVFALGFQQQIIHHRRHLLAMLNATTIGMLNLLLLKLGPQASPSEMIAFIAGQPLGTLAALWLIGRYFGVRPGSAQRDSAKMATI